MSKIDRSRFLATLLDLAGSCTDLAGFRLEVLAMLRRAMGCDGALFRPGGRWVGSRALYLDEGSRFVDGYIAQVDRFAPELRTWCALSRGRVAFIDDVVYSLSQRDRMGVYGEVIRADGIRSILACPLSLGSTTVGLIFLFRRGRVSPFPEEVATAATGVLSALALAEHVLMAAFARGRRAERPATEDAFAALAPREQQVASLLGYGLSDKEIAELLGSSHHTVHVQARKVFHKLAVHNRTQVALVAQRIGLAGHAPGGDLVLQSFRDLLLRGLGRRFSGLEEAASLNPPPTAAPAPALGARERQVAELVARGLTSRAVAAILGTSFHTVRAQRRRILEKMGVPRGAGLARALARYGG